MRKIDLRGNPITVGFYPPAISGSGRTATETTKEIANGKDSRARGSDGLLAITNMGHCADIAYEGAGVIDRIGNGDKGVEDVLDGDEIDDPYTLPAADMDADKKYTSHLDEGTRLRRRVVELMISTATAGRIKLLDGLAMVGDGDGDGDGVNYLERNDSVMKKLKELQVFRKKGGGDEEDL